MRNKVIVGNWKMNHTRANALAFVEGMKEAIQVAKSHNVLVGIAPTFMSLDVVGNNKSEDLILSAQNVNEHASGAYTGEVSISMLQEVKGLTHIIIGHSERRQYYKETNASCNAKMKAMAEADLERQKKAIQQREALEKRNEEQKQNPSEKTKNKKQIFSRTDCYYDIICMVGTCSLRILQ